eukprot:604237-Amphidinium_carterae.1
MDSSFIISQLHGAPLRATASHGGTHFQGLGQVARRRDLQLSTRIRRKLLAIDGALKICKHITEISARDVYIEFLQELVRDQGFVRADVAEHATATEECADTQTTLRSNAAVDAPSSRGALPRDGGRWLIPLGLEGGWGSLWRAARAFCIVARISPC